ncbi:hypothetical protein M0802_007537 [Mischocyttarus mexicanus]|nr:hypothetical protein M0802_014111 [Mischocyttarus mexicanus]KAI4497290.1 hypothetical protein M0802_007537 [Mischocyttarus mexicanus]
MVGRKVMPDVNGQKEEVLGRNEKWERESWVVVCGRGLRVLLRKCSPDDRDRIEKWRRKEEEEEEEAWLDLSVAGVHLAIK